MKTHNSEVCLLYSESDKAIAGLLENALNYYSIDIWKAQNISIGGKIISETTKVLEKAKFIIVLWSQTSIKSALLKDLASEAKRNKKVLIPVLIESVNIPSEFIDIQPANLVGWDGDKENEQIVKLWRLIQDSVLRYRRKIVGFNQFIGIVSLILTAIGVIFTITTPEVRCWLKLQCPENTSSENTVKHQETLTQSPSPITEKLTQPPKIVETPQPPSPATTTPLETTNVPVSPAIKQKSQQTTLEPQSVDEEGKLKFEAHNCYRTSSTKVVCDVLVTNSSNKRQDILFTGNASENWVTNAIDTSGNVY
ncbi:MAG: TIR domain-containing protein, partial [Nostocaceae cyanobacterium]|nr:TIR domain-containing protein [Nostocaceae cyanobacterium]